MKKEIFILFLFFIFCSCFQNEKLMAEEPSNIAEEFIGLWGAEDNYSDFSEKSLLSYLIIDKIDQDNYLILLIQGSNYVYKGITEKGFIFREGAGYVREGGTGSVIRGIGKMNGNKIIMYHKGNKYTLFFKGIFSKKNKLILRTILKSESKGFNLSFIDVDKREFKKQ